MKHLISLLCLLLLPACVFAQTSGQNVIQKKNASAGFSYESFTLGNSQLIGRTSAGVLNGLTLGSGLSLSGTTLSASGSSLTIGTTAITGGTSGHVLYNNAGTLGGLDLSALYAPIASPTFTGTVTLGSGGIVSSNPLFPTRTIGLANSVLSWQNVNGSGFGVSFSPSTPTADRIISFNPNGALVTTQDTGTVTDPMLAGSISLSKLAITGTANSTTYLRGDGAWTAIDLSAYLTTATAASTYLPLAGGTLTGALTLPAGAAGTAALTFTGAGSGTHLYSSGASSIDIAIGGVQRYNFGSGNLNCNGVGIQISGGNLLVTNTYMRQDGPTLRMGASDDVALGRDGAAETMALGRRNTSSNTFRIYNTYTSSTSYERASLGWASNIFVVKPEKGSGGGTARRARYYTAETVWFGSGSGSPEGVETAGIGSLYTDEATGTLYRKTSGTGNTGWVTP